MRPDWQEILDSGLGCCLLRLPIAAQVVQKSLLHFAGVRFHLHGWVIMPNHVHVLLQTIPPWSLSRCVASWKSYSGRRLASIADMVGLPRAPDGSRRVWAREYWDRYMRDDSHAEHTLREILLDPVRAGLVARVEDWEWCGTCEGQARTARLEPGGPAPDQ